MKFTARAAWVLVFLSVLVSAGVVRLRFESRSIGTVGLAEYLAQAFYILVALCFFNLVGAIVAQVRAKQLHVRPLALTAIAALLPLFVIAFCAAAGIGRH